MDCLKISFLVFLCSSMAYDVNGVNVFNIIDNGAVPDGETDCSQALLRTWDQACKADEGVVLVPVGTFLVKSALFQGPCLGVTVLNVLGTLRASSGWINVESWIEFNHVDRLMIRGNGVLDGQGASTWANCKAKGSSFCSGRPPSMKLKFVRNSLIQGITSKDSKMFHFHINNCDNVEVTRVSISAPGDSPNTDGIHVGDSNNIRLNNLNIGTGDDCISLGSGTTNIYISNIACGPGHGLSIGSLGKYRNEQNVAGIFIRNCILRNTQNGVRIKTWAPSPPSSVSDITFQDITLHNVDNPVLIDQYYCPNGGCSHEGESSVQIKGVKYINIRGTSSIKDAVQVFCSRSRPCQDIEFSGLDITRAENGEGTVASCSNANGIFRGNIVPSKCVS